MACLVSPGDLPGEWRKRAEFLSEYGDPNTGRLWLLASQELEQALKATDEDTLSLVEAARVSGYTADYLGHLVRSHKLPNYGRKNAPRVRRGDLPVKTPNRGRPASKRSANTDVTDIRALR